MFNVKNKKKKSMTFCKTYIYIYNYTGVFTLKGILHTKIKSLTLSTYQIHLFGICQP